MIAIPRTLARTFRTVLRRCLAPPGLRTEPPLVLACSDGQTLTLQACGADLAVRHTTPDSAPADTLAFRAKVLAQIEGKTDEAVTLEAISAGRGRAVRTENGVPQSVEFDTVDPARCPEFPQVPARLSSVPESFLVALGEATRTTAREASRFAVTRVQLRGRSGQVVATDGRQMLVQGGFSLPWTDSLLVTRLPLLDLSGVFVAGPARLARAGDHVILRVGQWTFWLAQDTNGRFPVVEEAIPRDKAFSRLRLDPEDATLLMATLPRLPGRDEDHAPVTLELGHPPAVRARSGTSGPAVEVVLARSEASGPPLRVVTDRQYLRRAAQLGFAVIRIQRSDVPLVCREADRTYVWMPLDASAALPPGPHVQRLDLTKAVPTPDEIPNEQRRTAMPPPPGNGHPSDDRPPPERNGSISDLIAEAETLRNLLSEASARSARLVTALKQHRRQAKAVEAAVVSLRQFNLGG